MTAARTQTSVPYTANEMFALVADVERYPEFIPWCLALRVVARDTGPEFAWLTADMVVAYKVFRERFRSHVTLDREHLAIDVQYVDGPFRTLRNQWRFSDYAEGGSSIDFSIDFEFRNVILQATAASVFEKAFSRMSEAFVSRASLVYGPRTSLSEPVQN